MTKKRYEFREQERADLRIIKKIFNTYGFSKPSQDVLEKVSLVYQNKGGSWSAFFEGNPDHIVLLKKIIKSYLKAIKKRKSK